MLQLNLVVVQQPPEKFVSRGRKPPLMEVHERDDVAIGRRWHVLLAGQSPLLGDGPRVEKTAADKALHALEGDIKKALHWKMGWVDANSTAAKTRMQRT